MPEYLPENVTRLAPGDSLIQPIYGDGRLKLLGSHCTLDERLIQRLAERGITEAAVERAKHRTAKESPKKLQPKSLTNHEIESTAPRLINHRCCCGVIITIHPPVPDLPASVWRCASCAANYFCASAERNTFAGVERVGIEVGSLQSAEKGPLPSNDSTIAGGTRDRRRYERFAVAAPIVAVPLGARFNITGHAERMKILDISQSGIALAHTRFTNAPYFALDFTVTGMELLQVVVQVLRVTHTGPLYEIAGRFISRLQSANNG
jgi:hypothetical protein